MFNSCKEVSVDRMFVILGMEGKKQPTTPWQVDTWADCESTSMTDIQHKTATRCRISIREKNHSHLLVSLSSEADVCHSYRHDDHNNESQSNDNNGCRYTSAVGTFDPSSGGGLGCGSGGCHDAGTATLRPCN